MRKKDIICIICPIGCKITVSGEESRIDSMEGHTCKRGEGYAKDEFIHPVRILTSSVKVNNGKKQLIAVRSDKPVPKELLLECMEEIKRAEITAPIKCKDIVIKDILGTGINIVATGCDI
ncbi:MAG: hypothetical protein APF77_04345 [Clostridia bacterium BRH_c25]|nr:MAG: hypothetical protein APF77_04345 [Clostridia bacterium BRH_c25]